MTDNNFPDDFVFYQQEQQQVFLTWSSCLKCGRVQTAVERFGCCWCLAGSAGAFITLATHPFFLFFPLSSYKFPLQNGFTRSKRRADGWVFTFESADKNTWGSVRVHLANMETIQRVFLDLSVSKVAPVPRGSGHARSLSWKPSAEFPNN